MFEKAVENADDPDVVADARYAGTKHSGAHTRQKGSGGGARRVLAFLEHTESPHLTSEGSHIAFVNMDRVQELEPNVSDGDAAQSGAVYTNWNRPRGKKT